MILVSVPRFFFGGGGKEHIKTFKNESGPMMLDILFIITGTLMEGKGLKNILETVYGENAVVHMMTGKAV